MQSFYPERFEREMACTEADWLQRPPALSVLVRLEPHERVPASHVALDGATLARCRVTAYDRVRIHVLPDVTPATPLPALRFTARRTGATVVSKNQVVQALRQAAAHYAAPTAHVPLTDGLAVTVDGAVFALHPVLPPTAATATPLAMCVVEAGQLPQLAVTVDSDGAEDAPPPATDDDLERGWAAAGAARFGGVDAVLAKLRTHLRACLTAPGLWRSVRVRHRPLYWVVWPLGTDAARPFCVSRCQGDWCTDAAQHRRDGGPRQWQDGTGAARACRPAPRSRGFSVRRAARWHAPSAPLTV